MEPNAALGRAVAGSQRAFMFVGMFSFFINLLMLTVPIYMMQMFDRVVPSGNTDTLILLTLMAGLALATMALLEGVRGRIMVKLGTWIDRELSGPILAGSMQEGVRTGGAQGAGGLRELQTVRNFLTGAGIFPLLDAPWVPLFVGIIFLLHPLLGFIAIGGAVIVFGFAIANDLMTRNALQRANAANARGLYRADAVVRNADVVSAMGMMPDITRRWSEANREGVAAQADASDTAGAISAGARYARLMLQVVMLGAGAWLVIQDQLTGGGMIAASIILSRAMAPVEQSISAWRGMIAAKSAFGTIRDLLVRTPTEGSAMPLPRPRGRLEVEGLSFVPAGSREPVLRTIGFEVEPGELLGIIGPSAAGKTSLVRILVGSWKPTAGHVRLDGADVACWESSDRGPHVGYLPQDVELFDGTVHENIARFSDAAPDEVIRAARLARVHDMILRLTDGYDTRIGEGGIRLSGGQRQRIALARAVFGDPCLVVLDEPNASLDSDGERALVQTLSDLKERGITVVVIVHRSSILAQADKLLMLRDGRIDLFGPRDRVMARLREMAISEGQAGAAKVRSVQGVGPTSPPVPAGTAPSGGGVVGTATLVANARPFRTSP